MTKRQKVLCIVMGSHFSESIGGSQYQAKCIVDNLVESGRFNIFYITRMRNAEYWPHGYKVLPIAPPGGIRRYSYALDALKVLKLLKEVKPDVIYQRALQGYTGLVAHYARRTRCRSVFHIASDHSLQEGHSYGLTPAGLLRRVDRAIGEYGVRRVDAVIAQTRHQSEMLERRFGRAADLILPNFHPLPKEVPVKESGQTRVVWVANFKRVKQPELFVALARDLAYRKDLQFIMIGRSGKARAYADLLAQIETLPNLAYSGELPIDDVNRELAKSHIFVNTSQNEGFPNTFIQAWMRKVPTLSISVDPDSLLSSGEFGYCGHTYEGLRDRILQLADDPQLMERMGEAAQRYAFETHSERVVQKLIRILDGPRDGEVT